MPSPCQTHNLYMNIIEKILEIIFIVVKRYHHVHMYTHTQRKYHCIFTETPHTQCKQASSQLVHNRIPWKPLWSQLPSTAAPSRSSTKSPRAAQKQVPSWCPPWAQQFSDHRPWWWLTGWLSHAAAGLQGVGCASEALDQLFWQPMGQPVERGLCLMTSGHSVQQHHSISCCLAVFGFQWFIWAFLWQMGGSDTHPLPLKARRYYTSDPVRFSGTCRKIALKYLV